MNRETSIIWEHFSKSGYAQERLEQLRDKYPNTKDFQTMLGYLIMEIVSEEKNFINLSRKNIDLPILSQMLFERNK